MRKSLQKLAILTCAALPLAQAGEVEVLHYWTSGGEADALDVLKDQIAAEGHQWRDFVIAGGGGGNAMAELQTRVLKGQPPAAAQIKGLDIQRWARLGFLENLNQIAESEQWDAKLPTVVADVMKHDNQYVAVPVNVHRTNWLWANKPLLDKLNLDAPSNWAEFDAAATAIEQAGYQVIAQGNQAWQHATLFEAIALSLGGPDYFRAAYVEHDFSALKSDTTEAVFERYFKMLDWMNFDEQNEWNENTAKVINGDAAFQFMGDWAKGEFRKAGKQPSTDYLCLPVPGTAGQFLFNIDSFAIFKLPETNAGQINAQSALVQNIMSESFQSAFNKTKGSIPARTDMSMADFDQCAKDSMSDFLAASNTDALVPSIAHGMATSGTIQQYFYEKIAELTANPIEPKKAASELAKAIRYGLYVIK